MFGDQPISEGGGAVERRCHTRHEQVNTAGRIQHPIRIPVLAGKICCRNPLCELLFKQSVHAYIAGLLHQALPLLREDPLQEL